jgi:hypothetical protein
MKLIYTFSISCLLALSASAQPTLTVATNMPTVGLSDIVKDGTTFSPGTSGASQTWDVTGVNFFNSFPGVYEPCSSSNGCNNSPNANMAYSLANTYVYYKASGSIFAMHGFFNGSKVTQYTDPEDYLRFPMTYGSRFVDSFRGSYPGTGGTWYRRGNDTVTADGWGTLITPAGTFTNALRIKVITTFKDTGTIMGAYDRIAYKGTTYYWYDTKHQDFLFTTASITVSPLSASPHTATYARYTMNETTTGISTLSSDGLRCEVVPNPVRARVQMNINLNASARVSASLLDITGREVRSLSAMLLNAGESKLNMPVEGLPAGVYTLRVVAGDAVKAMKVVIE